MSFVISSLVSTLLEVDEVSTEPLPDGKVKVTFLTTGINEDLVALKTKVWALLCPPLQRVESVKVYELQRGPLTKRYKVEVVLRPLFR